MIIAIDGPQGSGKTTCWRALQEWKLVRDKVEFIPEMARIVAPMFGVKREADWEEIICDPPRLRGFFSVELALLKEWESSDTRRHIVVDSSAILVAAYVRTFLSEGFTVPEPRRYDLIFWCEPWPDVARDGFRFVYGRDVVSRAYRGIIAESGVEDRLVTLPATTDRFAALRSHPIWRRIADEG